MQVDETGGATMYSHWACVHNGRVIPVPPKTVETEMPMSFDGMESIIIMLVITILVGHVLYAFRDWFSFTKESSSSSSSSSSSKIRISRPATSDEMVDTRMGNEGGRAMDETSKDNPIVKQGHLLPPPTHHVQQPWLGPPPPTTMFGEPEVVVGRGDIEGQVPQPSVFSSASAVNRFAPFLPTVHEEALPTTVHAAPSSSALQSLYSGGTTSLSQTTSASLENTLSIKEALAVKEGRHHASANSLTALSTKFGPLAVDKRPTIYSPSKMSSRLSSSSGSQHGHGLRERHRAAHIDHPDRRGHDVRNRKDHRASSDSGRRIDHTHRNGRDRESDRDRRSGGGSRRKYDDYDSYDSQYDSESDSDSQYDSDSYSSIDGDRRNTNHYHTGYHYRSASDRRRNSRSSRSTPKQQRRRPRQPQLQPQPQPQLQPQMLPIPMPMPIAQYPYAPYMDPYYRHMSMPPGYPPYFDPRGPPEQYGMYPPSGDPYEQHRSRPPLHIDTRGPMALNVARQRGFSEDYVVDRPAAAGTSRTPVKGLNSNQARFQHQSQELFYEDDDQDEIKQFQEDQLTPSKQKQQRQQQQIKRHPSKQQLQQHESPKLSAPAAISPTGRMIARSGSSNSLRKLQSA